MKYEVSNSFHDTEAIVSVKSEYCIDEGGWHSPDIWMQFEIYNHGDDAAYCRRKLREVKNKLCGSDSCECGGAQKWTRI